jgi:hypothetical protein
MDSKITIKKRVAGEKSNMTSFNLNFEVSDSRIEVFYRPLRESSREYLRKVGPIGSKIVQALFKIDGITEVFIKPYEVTIEKGEAFGWYEIDPLVEAILLDQAPPVVVNYTEESLWHHFKRVIASWWKSVIDKIKVLILKISDWKIFHLKTK